MVYEEKMLEIKYPDVENTLKNVSKRRKVLIKTASAHDGKEQLKYEANAYGAKYYLNHHVAIVHEGEKQFKCDICNAQFTSKYGMKGHIAAIH